MRNEIFTVSQVANLKDISRGAVYSAIKSKRLNFYKVEGRIMITYKDLINYWDSRYKRSRPDTFEKESYFTPKEMSIKFNINIGNIYSGIYHNRLKFQRHGSMYYISREHIDAYIQRQQKRKTKKSARK